MPKGRSKGINLHPKYGVNPTMPVCAWCSQPTGEVALLGASYPEKAPTHMVMNDEPCAVCRAKMRRGITFIEHESNRPGAKRTGRWAVLTENAVARLISDPTLRATVLAARKCAITRDVADRLDLFDRAVN